MNLSEAWKLWDVVWIKSSPPRRAIRTDNLDYFVWRWNTLATRSSRRGVPPAVSPWIFRFSFSSFSFARLSLSSALIVSFNCSVCLCCRRFRCLASFSACLFASRICCLACCLAFFSLSLSSAFVKFLVGNLFQSFTLILWVGKFLSIGQNVLLNPAI